MRSRIPQKELDLLGSVPLFSQCSKAELREIAKIGTRLEVAAGTDLTTEGSRGQQSFLLIEGKARCTVRGAAVAKLGPGDFFGELSLIDGGPRSATVTAVTPLTVTVLNAYEFDHLLRAAPSIAVKLLVTLAGRLRDAQASAVY